MRGLQQDNHITQHTQYNTNNTPHMIAFWKPEGQRSTIKSSHLTLHIIHHTLHMIPFWKP